jgi:hypothetical protein
MCVCRPTSHPSPRFSPVTHQSPAIARPAGSLGSTVRALMTLLLATGLACGESVVGPPAVLVVDPLQIAFHDGTENGTLPAGRLGIQLRTAAGDIIADTLLAVDDTTHEVALTLASIARSPFTTLLAEAVLVGLSDDTLFRSEPTSVVTRTGTATETPTVLLLQYVGPGATTAASIRFTSSAASGFSGDTVDVTAEVLDAQGNVIPGVPVLWSSADASTGRVLRRDDGRVVLGNARGAAVVRARTYTTLVDSLAIAVEPLPVAAELPDGALRADTIGVPLTTPLRVRLLAADSEPVLGLGVRFIGAPELGIADTVVLSDSNGIASLGATLPTTAGPYAVQATSLRGSAAALFTVTVLPGAPEALRLVGGPATTLRAGDAVPTVSATITDRAENVVTSFTETVELRLLDANGGLVGTPRSVAALAGVATFANITVEQIGVGFVLELLAPGLPASRSAPFDVTAGAATMLVLRSSLPATSEAGVTLSALTVEAQDGFGNLAADFTGTVTATLGVNPTATTLSGTTSLPAIGGLVSFTALQLTRAGTGYTIALSANSLTGVETSPFDVTPAAAAVLTITEQPPTTVPVGQDFSLTAEVRDAFGNVTPSFTDSVRVTIGASPGEATLGGTTARLPSSGVVTFDNLSLDQGGDGYTLVVAAGSLTSATSTAIDVSVVPAVPTTVVVEPSSAAPERGSTLQFSAQVFDQFGLLMADVPITWASTDPCVAAVSATGLAESYGGGTATISATAGLATGTATVSVPGGAAGVPATVQGTWRVCDTNQRTYLYDVALNHTEGLTGVTGLLTYPSGTSHSLSGSWSNDVLSFSWTQIVQGGARTFGIVGGVAQAQDIIIARYNDRVCLCTRDVKLVRLVVP